MVDSADVSMASVDFDSSLREVELLSDEELYVKLRSTGKDVGPVVDTTRKLYQKQLANIMSSPNSSFYSQGNTSINSNNVTNGSTENGFTDSEEEKFDTSSRASRSSRASSSTNKKPEVLFTPRLRNYTKEPEVKKKLVSEEFVARRDSRPQRTFEEYVAESEAKKAKYGDAYLRKDVQQSAGQLGSDDGVLLASKPTPMWQIVALLVVLLAIFAVVYVSIMEKKLDQNSIIDQEIEELTKQNQ